MFKDRKEFEEALAKSVEGMVEELEKAKQEKGADPKMKRRIRDARAGKGVDKLHEKEQAVATDSLVGESQESHWRKPKSGESHIKLDHEETKELHDFAGKKAAPKAGKAFVASTGASQQGIDAAYRHVTREDNLAAAKEALKNRKVTKARQEFEQALAKSVEKIKQELRKDDAPHAPGSAADSAHDVVEEGSSLQEEIKNLTPEEKKSMLDHLRSLKDKRKLRSDKNKEVGKD